MKLVTAFFMAWGNFLKIPCPVKKWDSKLNKMMLAFLPSIGALVGIILALAVALMVMVAPWIPSVSIRALVVFLVPMICCGFIHLDGFMDVNDAVLSRRDLAERQRILKDSATGAFAVITLVILMIAFFVGVVSLIEAGPKLPIGAVLLIPIISRTWSGFDVLVKKKIGVSQYAANEKATGKEKAVFLIQWLIYVGASIAICHSLWYVAVLVGAIEHLALLACGAFARKQLGGMNGDIAGYEIVMAECVGVFALGVIMNFV